jgi:hypothetical protein
MAATCAVKREWSKTGFSSSENVKKNKKRFLTLRRMMACIMLGFGAAPIETRSQ